MNYLHTKRKKERIAAILILCVAPCLLVIPVLCGPAETSLYSAKAYCPTMILALTSDTPLLAEDIASINEPEDPALLTEYKETTYYPILVFSEDKPPKTLA